MKKIECIIRPEKLSELSEAVIFAGAFGATVTEVKGFGRETTRPVNFLFLPKTKVEMYVLDECLEEVIEAIESCCRDQSLGSGKIAVLAVEECVRVRTGERGEKALT